MVFYSSLIPKKQLLISSIFFVFPIANAKSNLAFHEDKRPPKIIPLSFMERALPSSLYSSSTLPEGTLVVKTMGIHFYRSQRTASLHFGRTFPQPIPSMTRPAAFPSIP